MEKLSKKDLKRKAEQHWEMSGMARQDRDMQDAERHQKLAQDYDNRIKVFKEK